MNLVKFYTGLQAVGCMGMIAATVGTAGRISTDIVQDFLILFLFVEMFKNWRKIADLDLKLRLTDYFVGTLEKKVITLRDHDSE